MELHLKLTKKCSFKLNQKPTQIHKKKTSKFFKQRTF